VSVGHGGRVGTSTIVIDIVVAVAFTVSIAITGTAVINRTSFISITGLPETSAAAL
jgi:hypothetical protein